MAQPVLRQSVSNAVAKGQSRTCTATFTNPTNQGALVVLVAVAGGGPATTLTPPSSDFVLLRDRSVGNLQVVAWYAEGAAVKSSLTVTSSADRSLQVRAMEYSGAAQSGALDKITVLTSQSDLCDTGTTAPTAQADEVVVAIVANRYASTTQQGFLGGLIRLFETVSPQYWGFLQSNADSDRTRLTCHHLIANVTSAFFLRGLLSSARDWVAILVTFRGGSSGPKRMSSTLAGPMLTTGGGGNLSAFGPLRSVGATAVLRTSSDVAWIGPYNWQYRLGGRSGLLIGSGTPFHVEGTDGLGGWQVRTSDDDLPRGDGALRGIDLETARQVVFSLNVDGGRAALEANMDLLYRALVPRRDEDFELLWRHPGGPLKMMRCRPVDLTRERSSAQLIIAAQKFALRAADPRHYSAVPHTVIIPNTAVGVDPQSTSVVNIGNSAAFPIVTIQGPNSGPAVSRIELVNSSSLVSLDIRLTLPKGSTLVADMEARVTGAPRSIIALDGVSKYGAWQLPRQAFQLDPDPLAEGGENLLFLRTEPAGAPVTATLDYRDTWSG